MKCVSRKANVEFDLDGIRNEKGRRRDFSWDDPICIYIKRERERNNIDGKSSRKESSVDGPGYE